MPQYEYLCKSCEKKFSTILTLADHDRSKVTSVPSAAVRRLNSSGQRSLQRLLKRVEPGQASS